MGINKFYFNGKSCLDFNAWIFGGGTYITPVKTVEKIPVAGRNGDVLFEDDKFENVFVPYQVIINKNFDNNFHNLMAWLLSARGYQRLEDDFSPDHFRLASYYSELVPTVRMRDDVGKFELTFDCKPQRWLREGQKDTTITNGTINNPTLFTSTPLIRAYGTGNFYINDVKCQIKSADVYTDIDCDIMECFKGDVNKDDQVYIPDFPKLYAGKNEVRCEGITKLEIVPRWWTI